MFNFFRGLCGGINAQIARAARDTINQDRDRYKLLPIGEKAASALTRAFGDILENGISEVEVPVTFYVRKNPTKKFLKNKLNT